MTMVLAYITYAVLILISPLIGMLSLRYVYPDVRTFVKAKEWALYMAFGLAAYIPAAVLTLTELVGPLYSPLGTDPVLFEYEGSALLTIVLFGVVLAVNSSIVDFVMVRRRKTTVVGVPKRVIRYGIQKQIAQNRQRKREEDINRITGNLENIAGEVKDMKPLFEQIRASVAKDRKRQKERVKESKAFRELAGQETMPGKSEEKAEEPEKEVKKPEDVEVIGDLKKVMEGSTSEELSRAEESAGKRKEEEAKTPKDVSISEDLESVMKTSTADELKKAQKEVKTKKPAEREKPGPEKPEPAEKGDREVLVRQLEEKLKKATEDAKKREKIDSLLTQLKQKLNEDYGKGSEYREKDVEDITRALRSLKEKEEDKGSIDKAKEEKGKKESDEEVGKSVISYSKAYPKKREGDVLKSVVGDVRQQLAEKEEAEEEGGEEGGEEEARWYEKGPKTESGGETGIPGMETGEEGEGSVEMFEDDLSFGEGMDEGLGEDMDLGEDLGGEFGDLGDLEDTDQSLDSGEFDGMFVNMGETKKEGCPNCGKKGTSIVYCSSCGKPFCSNCASSVEGSEDFIKYRCPHCKSEFAMKRRAT
jgi:hypothetical protein